jgi:hypothetical protein
MERLGDPIAARRNGGNVAHFFTNHAAAPRRGGLGLVVLLATVAVGGGVAEANGGAKYDFRFFPTVGTPTTMFRVTFSAPFRANDTDTWYALEAVGPRRCPSVFEFTGRRIRRGDRVVMRLTAFDDLFLNIRRTWCRGSYVGYVYFSGLTADRIIGYFRFGVGRTPVSLEG